MAQAGLTARRKSRADAKAEHSEPTLCIRCRERLPDKSYPGDNRGGGGGGGWYRPSVHSDGGVRHLDVGSPHPGAGEGPKGLAVRQLKWYASWVQTVQEFSFEDF